MAESRDIFIVCNSIHELGGLVQWAHDIARLFSARGHRVHLIGVSPANEVRDYGSDLPYATTTLHDRPVPPKVRMEGLTRVNPTARMRHRRREALVNQAAEELSEIFRAARPGAVVIAAQVWAMEWVHRADTTGKLVIGMSHESYEATRDSSRYARVKRFYADVDIHLVLTADDADAWARDGMSNIGAMPNPLMVRPVTMPTLEKPAVVTLARLDHIKGIDLLLESWAQVAPHFPHWRLDVFGSGTEEEALRRQARDLGLDDQQIFRGMTNDVDGALSDASVFALPSRGEGFPIALMEAMAYGLPVVAFDCAPGVRELLTDEESGLIINPGNVLGFAAALERLMKDADLRRRLGAQARESVARFMPDPIVDRWEELFQLLER